MKSSPLNILILDDNTLIVDSLCKHLNTRFGQSVNISTFFDADKCIRNIDEKSHVIILDYFLNDKDKGFGNGMNIFEQIKNLNPKTKTIIISANKSASSAIEEIEIKASEYIMKKGRYPNGAMRLLDKAIVLPIQTMVSPIKTIVTLPARKMKHYYNAKDYLRMFLVGIISTGILVAIVYLSA